MKAVSVALLAGTAAGADCVLSADAKKVFAGDMTTPADMQTAALNIYKMIPKHDENGGAIGKDGTAKCADTGFCNCPMKVLCDDTEGPKAMKAIQDSMGKDKMLCEDKEAKYADFQKTVCGDKGANIKAEKTKLECKSNSCAAAESGSLESADNCGKYKVSYKAPTENANASAVALMLPAAVVAFFM